MAAVLGLGAWEIESAIKDTKAEIANYNCPGQIVITGPKAAVEEASLKLKEAGARRVLPLAVSGPFHSSLLQNAGNVTAECVTDISQTKELLAKQISSSVRWQQSVEKMLAEGVDTFVEIGPGKTLAGFMRKIAPDVKTYNIQKVEDLDQIAEILGSR